MIHAPSLIHAGRSVVISPDGSGILPPDVWASYALICLLEPDPAKPLIRKLEDFLGVSDQDRLAVAQAQESARRAQIRADQEARGLRAKPGPVKSQLPASERGRSESDLKRVGIILTKLSRTDLKKEKREDLERELDGLLHGPARKAQADWERAAADETVSLAEGRGEEVSRQASGAIRVNDRDPLLSLLRVGRLTVAQYDAGTALRDLYERRGEGLGSQMGALGGVTSPTCDNSTAVFYGVQRGKALQKVAIVERAVALQCRNEPAALQMLRGVCDLGRSLRSYGAGRAFDRHATALALALDVASDIVCPSATAKQA